MITGTTQLLGVIGNPVAHSASPRMQNMALAQLGEDYKYVPLHMDSEDQVCHFLNSMVGSNIRGVNITIPYKEAVMSVLQTGPNEVDSLGTIIGAVNTIVNEGDRLVGYNTDAMGFAGSVMLETGIEEPFKDKNVVMLGAGGAAKAIAYIIIQKQCRSLTILNRSADRAQSLADHLMEMLPLMAETIPGFQSPVILADNSLKDSVLVPLSEADCVINTTAVGMGKTEGQLPVPSMEWVRKDQLCCDIIYTPLETEWLRQIREKGARGLNGTGMLAAQGILALELFTGRPHLLKDLYSNMVAEIQDQVKLTQAPRR